MTQNKKNRRKGAWLKLVVRLAGLLLLVFLLCIAVIHIPSVQSLIGTRGTKYLSEKTGSNITLETLRFSILGSLELRGLHADDPTGEQVLHVGYLSTETDLISLFQKVITLDQLVIHDFDGRLAQTETGLSIDYIIDAFVTEKDTTLNPTSSLLITSDHLELKNIHFGFSSSSVDLEVSLDSASVSSTDVLISPNEITVDSFFVAGVSTSILLPDEEVPSGQDTLSNDSEIILPPLDFGSGFKIGLGVGAIVESDLAVHFGERIATDKFNPDHIDMDNVNIRVMDSKVSDTGFAAETISIDADVGGKATLLLSKGLDVSDDQLKIEVLKLERGQSEIEAQFEGRYDVWTRFIQDLDRAEVDVEAHAKASPRDITYFMPDTILALVADLPYVEMILRAGHARGITQVMPSTIVAGDSEVSISGRIEAIFDRQRSIGWPELNLECVSGTVIDGILAEVIGRQNLPDDIVVSIESSGNIEDFTLQGTTTSSWGVLGIDGSFGYRSDEFRWDAMANGDKIELDEITGESRLDTCSFEIETKGAYREILEMQVVGIMPVLLVEGKPVHDILIDADIKGDSIWVIAEVQDSEYLAQIDVGIVSGDTLSLRSKVRFDNFSIGHFVGADSLVRISADLDGNFTQAPDFAAAQVSIDSFYFFGLNRKYEGDTLTLNYYESSDSSHVMLDSRIAAGSFSGNFPVSDLVSLLDTLIRSNLSKESMLDESTNEHFVFDFVIQDPALFKLMNYEVNAFSDIEMHGTLVPENGQLTLNVSSGFFEGAGVQLDTLLLSFESDPDASVLDAYVDGIYYDSIRIGRLDWSLKGKSGGYYSDLTVLGDSLQLLGLSGNVTADSGAISTSLDSVVLLGERFASDAPHLVSLFGDSIVFDNVAFSGNGGHLRIDGHNRSLRFDIDNFPVEPFNYFIESDSVKIESGWLNLGLVFDYPRRFLDLEMTIDSFRITNSPELEVSAIASTRDDLIPFAMRFVGEKNDFVVEGEYNWKDETLDGQVDIDVTNLTPFELFTHRILRDMRGAVIGTAKVSGPVESLNVNGDLRLKDFTVTLLNPRTQINISDERVEFNNYGISLNEFTIRDKNGNPLILDGQLSTEDYRSFDYDLTITTEEYVVLDNPRTSEYSLQGLLAVGGDIKLTGNQENAFLEADLRVSDSTNLVFVVPEREFELMTSDGIVEFVDPNAPIDSLQEQVEVSFFDSLMANLPDLNLTSTLSLNDRAVFKVVVDPRSGNYLEASGKANLKLDYDRTGNAQLNGTYSITKGVYKLSFYDIVKKQFQIANGSRIQWSGIPEDGALNITAKHTVKASSIGLIGNEVGENEKVQYRKALPYVVSIYIKGSINEPEVSFGLDLPESEKASYPALQSKLTRLDQPEYESELNKQVFGLLVLGGFIPQSSGSDFDEMAVATTAIANSVNALLAAQLNRLTNKIEGVDINIGLQSYSDFQQGSSTRTAMDFRVSKSILEDRLTFEVGAEVGLDSGENGPDYGDNFRGDITVTYDLTESGNRKLKAFNNETYDIIYHEVRNTGVALIFIREFDKGEKVNKRKEE